MSKEEVVKVNYKITDSRIRVCEKIAEDVGKDAEEFDGKPFNGKTVAQYFGNHGAAIEALANLVKSLLEENLKLHTEQKVQESDTTDDDSSTEAGTQK